MAAVLRLVHSYTFGIFLNLKNSNNVFLTISFILKSKNEQFCVLMYNRPNLGIADPKSDRSQRVWFELQKDLCLTFKLINSSEY